MSCQYKAFLGHNWTSVLGGFLQGDRKMTPGKNDVMPGLGVVFRCVLFFIPLLLLLLLSSLDYEQAFECSASRLLACLLTFW